MPLIALLSFFLIVLGLIAMIVAACAFSAYAVTNSSSFPASWLEFITAFLIGELLCFTTGLGLALRSRNRRLTSATKQLSMVHSDEHEGKVCRHS